MDKKIVAKLLNGGYIEQRGKTSGTYYILGKEYYELAGRLTDYSKITDWDENQAFTMIASFLKNNASAKMGDFVNLLSGNLSRKQIRTYIEKMVDNGMLTFEGEAKKRTYSLNRKYKDEMALINKAVEIGLIEIREQTKGRKNGQ